MEEERKIEELQRLIDTHENIVFFGGAGVSTESGIPDFRSVDGLYHQKYDVPPETILSHSYSCGTRKVLCFLPRQNASGRRETERGA